MLPNGDVVSVTYNVEVKNCSKVLEFICHIPAIKVFSLLLSFISNEQSHNKKKIHQRASYSLLHSQGLLSPKAVYPH